MEYEQVPGRVPGIMQPKNPGEAVVRVNLSARPVCPTCGVPLSGSIDRTPDGGRMIECLNPQCLSTWDWDEGAQRPVAHKRNAVLTGWQCPVCGRGLSPFVSVCPDLHFKIATSNTTER